MSPRLWAVPDAPATAGLPLVVTGALVSVPGGLAVEVVVDGQRAVDQARDLIKWLRANQTATSRILNAVLDGRADTGPAVTALAAWLLDAQRLELTVEDVDALVDQLGDAAQAARTTDPADVDSWAAADLAVTAALEGSRR